MRNLYSDSEAVRIDNQLADGATQKIEGLPSRLLTALEVAAFVGCHEETVRRAYLRGLLKSQRFGVRRFPPARRAGLDPARRTHTSLVITKEEHMQEDDP